MQQKLGQICSNTTDMSDTTDTNITEKTFLTLLLGRKPCQNVLYFG